MSLEHARLLHPLLCRDLVVVVSSRPSFESLLGPFARRRTTVYDDPRSAGAGEAWWVGVAAALAPVGAPEWMPMGSLVDSGVSLEGGARGLRGLFVREPSDKERKKVVKVATLVARIMDIIARADRGLNVDEQRLIAMAMASFGLNPEEFAIVRPTGPVGYDSLQIFGDLDARTRREILRGTWQTALVERIEQQKDLAVRAIAKRLELTAECDQVRMEVLTQQTRQGEMATLAVELARGPARGLPVDQVRPWMEHLVLTAAPAVRRTEMLGVAFSDAPVETDKLPNLDPPRRRQAVALALVTLMGHCPLLSTSSHLRAELTSLGVAAGAGAEVSEAFHAVDTYLMERIRDHSIHPKDPLPLPGQNAHGTQPAQSTQSAPSAPQLPPGEMDLPLPPPPTHHGGSRG